MALSKSVFNPAKAIHSKVVIFSLLAAAFLVVLFFISTLVMDDENDFFDKKKHNKAHVDITQEVKELLEDAKLQEQTGEHKTIVVKGSSKKLDLNDPKTKEYVEAFKEAVKEYQEEESKNAQEEGEPKSNTEVVVIKDEETVEPTDTKKALSDTAQEQEQSKLTVVSNTKENLLEDTNLQELTEKSQADKTEYPQETESKKADANTLKQDLLSKESHTAPNLESSKTSVEPTLESNSKSTTQDETTSDTDTKVTVVDLNKLEKSDKSESVSNWAKEHTKLKQKSGESPKIQDKEQQKAINEEEKLNKTLDILDEVL